MDYSKAFDSLTYNSIWKALKACNINNTYINILKNLYSKSTSQVKLERRGDNIIIGRGVRQGDPISPKLFIAVLEDIFQNIDWKNKGLMIKDQHLTHLRFADDIVLFAKTANELNQISE